MSAAGLLAPAPAPAGAPPAPEYYPEEDEELESAEDDERSCRGRESDEDTEDASETDLAKHDEEDYVEMKEQMYQDKLASLKRQLQQLQEGTLQEYQKRMKKLDQQYKERIRNAELFLQLEVSTMDLLGLQALSETGISLSQSVAFPSIAKQLVGKPPAGSLPSLFCLTKGLWSQFRNSIYSLVCQAASAYHRVLGDTHPSLLSCWL
ncbi:SDS3-like protein, SIN3A corepressor complex component [Rhinolophus ferrumequinum]|uniref:SDS3-like protein, SIN3A corepressor complex component n=1 Tax=Rhinolophus ferrumequinum TaxID=59479 RepID=A0A7J7RQV2_RHIFE|nr:SDS3-like protein, SIN3A corepressor complex component [Rhinolophus ferrumequinum]